MILPFTSSLWQSIIFLFFWWFLSDDFVWFFIFIRDFFGVCIFLDFSVKFWDFLVKCFGFISDFFFYFSVKFYHYSQANPITASLRHRAWVPVVEQTRRAKCRPVGWEPYMKQSNEKTNGWRNPVKVKVRVKRWGRWALLQQLLNQVASPSPLGQN